jgi:hypothetical protein
VYKETVSVVLSFNVFSLLMTCQVWKILVLRLVSGTKAKMRGDRRGVEEKSWHKAREERERERESKRRE